MAYIQVSTETTGGGTGDVVGPASSTDNRIVRFNGSTGKLIQTSAVTIDDSGNLTGVGTINGVTVGGSSETGFVVWTPSDDTGATNMTDELETFVEDNPGVQVRIKDGSTVLLNNFGATLADDADINIDANNCLILYDEGEKAIFLSNVANASSEATVSSISQQTVNTDALVSRVTLGSTLGIQKFDVVAIYSSDANPAISGGKIGEITQAMTSEATLVFDTMERLRRASSYATSVKCRKLDKNRKLKWVGGRFQANGDANDAAITDRAFCFHIVGWVDPIVRDVIFDKPWAQALEVQCCAFGKFDNIEVRDIANLSASNGYSYGVTLYGMNYGHTIRNITVRNGRHPAFTTDGNTSSSTWWQIGIPTNNMLYSVTGINCNGALVDTHEEGDGLLIDGVQSINPCQLSTSSLTGTLMQIRCAHVTLRNVSQIGGARVIKVSAVDHGFRDQIIIQGVSAYGLGAPTDTDVLFELEDQSGLTNKRDIQITDVNAADVGLGFLIGKRVPVTIDRVTLAKVDTVGDVYGGTDVVVGSIMVDYRNNTRSAANYFWKCRSDGTYGGCKIIHTQNPIILKGSTANNPAQLFEERDTTANKSVYAPGITEYNPSATTTTTLYESGATTLIPATDIADRVPHTITAPLTTGNQTINKPKGRVNIAASGTAITVTNNLVSTSSMVICEVGSNDTTAQIKNVVKSSGSFTVNMAAAVTAETPIDFFVINGF